MEIKVLRPQAGKKDKYTIGKMTIEGNSFKCDTLEDTDRGLTSTMTKELISSIKQKGITAIPTGRYKIVMNVVSPKFSSYKQYQNIGGKLPRLVDVPGYEGVLIHIGNKHEDTDGCILVGENKVVGQVINSTATFNKLYPILKEASDRGEEIWITIE